MSESWKINRILNELMTKPSSSRTRLDASTALSYAAALKPNILNSEDQDKVNSISVLAKLLQCTPGAGPLDFSSIFDEELFSMLLETARKTNSPDLYRAILSICSTSITGSIYPAQANESSIDVHLPLYKALVTHLDAIDMITAKLYAADLKTLLYSVHLVTGLIKRALKFKYDKIITLTGRLKHVKFFATVANSSESSDQILQEAIAQLEYYYFYLNEYLSNTMFDLSLESHNVMMRNLFEFLDVSLNEFGTPASTAEYVKAGFTADPQKFVADNFSILLAMDLKIFLKDPNMTFKKRFHEELIMSDHNRTFPLYHFISECTKLWIDVFHDKKRYPRLNVHILSWELMIYFSMYNCLLLWQDTKAQLENTEDMSGIVKLLQANVKYLEESLGQDVSIEDALEVFTKRTSEQIRHYQILEMKKQHHSKWAPYFSEFDSTLQREVMDFVCEQRVMQLLKGSWVLTEAHAERLKNKTSTSVDNSYYFLMLSPNRKAILYKYFAEKPTLKPSLEEMEASYVELKDIAHYSSVKIGQSLGEEDKAKHGRLISVKGSICYERLTLLNKADKPLLTFFTDSEMKKAVWLDGLKMLKGSLGFNELSKETTSQLASLKDIRKNTQLLVLEGKAFANVEFDGESDDEFYDLSELNRASEGFYYV
ncbi:hypothetical protein FT663_05448 [Candidozyma haemuli var. vulneris]|uniref:PH domain-containing protein n=1 Tax=Candidozyma haemuli TaxID=45357 RepID=A0A2V1B069_9ASCO|nr:hypothetical protein CXQ85_003151 [[Candida] haemuloni]KAF3985054.1 hypothetical protein FT663_05448 [[Candida] haemuloni var. vulneris]KAF3988575.1 hypothetical protein FT662_03320 [[Candida] haemuloni var. vulneris]PVH23414.1 hypothetical protein CXQ85_003151 [[Candida] haemuloni]